MCDDEKNIDIDVDVDVDGTLRKLNVMKGLNDFKSLRIYTKRLLTKFEASLIKTQKGEMNSTDFNTILSALKFIQSCIDKDQTEKIDLLEQQLIGYEELIKKSGIEI